MATTQAITGTYSTLSGQPGTFVSENPPFHPNILNLYGRKLGITNAGYGRDNPIVDLPVDTVRGVANDELYRGLMVTRPTTGGYAQQYRVNFLYNPATIHESRSLDLNNDVLPTYARNPDDPGQYATGMNTSIGFSLLFDRTYELWDKAYAGTEAGTFGVMADVNAFYNMLNINQQVTVTPPQAIGGSVPFSSTSYGQIVQGAMTAVPVDLYFGYKSPGALKYFGYITQFDVTYTHFTQKMVVQRCAINIGFQVMSDLYTTSVAQQQQTSNNLKSPNNVFSTTPPQ